MISEWVRALLDLILMAMVGVGLVQASRLIKHLAGLRQSRGEMERFVRDFNATVIRAEAGIKGLRQAARDSGDDLEKLVEKSILVRDELNFIVESADQIAERLSQSASSAMKPEPPKPTASRPAPQAEIRTEARAAEPRAATAPNKQPIKDAPSGEDVPPPAPPETRGPSSRAEKELLQALQKLS